MVNVQPMVYEKITAFKERVEIVSKLNEVIDFLNTFETDINSEITDFETGINSEITNFESTVNNAIANKQDTLISGTNIKTINNENILGFGNINISGGSSPTFSFGFAYADQSKQFNYPTTFTEQERTFLIGFHKGYGLSFIIPGQAIASNPNMDVTIDSYAKFYYSGLNDTVTVTNTATGLLYIALVTFTE